MTPITEDQSSRLGAFVKEVGRIVAEAGRSSEEEITSRIEVLLREVLTGGLQLAPGYREPRADRYVMYPLAVARDGSWSIASAVWDVGQAAPIHDHGTWGVIGILAGVEHEIGYWKPSPGDAGPLRLRMEHDLHPGEVMVCCTRDQDVHSVACAASVPCVGVHVYGADIGTVTRHTYDLATGAQRDFVSTWVLPAGVAELPWVTP